MKTKTARAALAASAIVLGGFAVLAHSASALPAATPVPRAAAMPRSDDGKLVSQRREVAEFQENPVPALGQNAKDQKAFDATKKGPRVLFVGNSITLHGPKPSIGWTNNWGMAASARDKDYVHLLQKRIAAVQPEAQCCLLQVAGSFERSFFKPDWSCEKRFRWAREFRPDMIVLFFGANVPKEYDKGAMTPTSARTFGEALTAFLDYLDPERKATVLLSQGFYVRPKLDAEKAVVAKARGCVYVDMADIQKSKEAHGRYNHPGDVGMQMIADRFWQSIEPRLKAR